MNERIEQLAEQAEKYADDNFKGEHFWTQAYESKFAELIVQECIDICQDVDGEDNIDARSGRQDCAVEIKEHFGVEV
jgi:hypothetical protein